MTHLSVVRVPLGSLRLLRVYRAQPLCPGCREVGVLQIRPLVGSAGDAAYFR